MWLMEPLMSPVGGDWTTIMYRLGLGLEEFVAYVVSRGTPGVRESVDVTPPSIALASSGWSRVACTGSGTLIFSSSSSSRDVYCGHDEGWIHSHSCTKKPEISALS